MVTGNKSFCYQVEKDELYPFCAVAPSCGETKEQESIESLTVEEDNR